ncbi:MAG TPA: hypothetical protein PKC49_12130, partial [Phycisphaerae bacterium]|nr:hypothetical protein [Phycisphaerae bacterium]
PFLWVLTGALLLNTPLRLFYYMRVVATMYLGAHEETGALRAPLSGKVALHLCAIILLLTGTLWIAPLKRNADGVATAAYPPRSVHAGAIVETSISVARSADVR